MGMAGIPVITELDNEEVKHLEKFIEEYKEQYEPLYKILAQRIADLLQDLLTEELIPVAYIEQRAKKSESLLDKLKRKHCKEPLEEIKDLAGIRVVTYYNDDVSRVCDIVSREFNVDPLHSNDKINELEVDEFGYRSFHLVCGFKEPRSNLPEWKRLSSLCFEVQVRSVLQHAWAAISHKLDYKSTSQAPQEIRRGLYRLSALLELADQEFASIRDRAAGVVAQYRQDVEKGTLNIPLNIDSLNQYLRERFNFDEWNKLGLQARLNKSNDYAKFDEADVQDNFLIFNSLGIRTVDELDDLLSKHKSQAVSILKMMSESVAGITAWPMNTMVYVLAIAEKHRLPHNFSWPEPWDDDMKSAMNHLLLK